MDFKVSTSSIDHSAALICVEGEFDLATAEQVEHAAELAIAMRSPVLLDLSECRFIDSSGLRTVLQIHGELTDGEGKSAPLAVVANSEIRRLFSLTAIDLRVPVFLTREQALQSLGASRSRINSPHDGEPAFPSPSHPTATAEGPAH
jgi:anti-anti-sigma factor